MREQQEHWSLQALREYTQQPVVYLKEQLNELCIYNKKVHISKFNSFPFPLSWAGVIYLRVSRTG
jgi:hypothetical protein